jgi:tetratricopeptide (TPR) repeat protein
MGWEAAILRATVEHHDPAGDRLAAIRAFEEGLQAGIPFAWAYTNLAGVYEDLDQFDAALKAAEAALRVAPGFPRARTLLASIHERRGETAEADAIAAGLVADPATAGLGYGLLGRLMSLRDRRAEAIDALREAVRLTPRDAFPWASLGELCLEAGDLAGAAEALETALRLAPGDFRALVNRGKLRQGAGNEAGARADLAAAVTTGPTRPSEWTAVADLRARLGDPAGAIADLTRGLALFPGVGALHDARGSLRHERDDLTGALEDFEAALAMATGHQRAVTLYNRSGARLEAGDHDGALADLTEALRVCPDYHADLHARLGQVQQARGAWAEAAAAYREFLRRLPGSPYVGSARDALAECEAELARGGAPRAR